MQFTDVLRLRLLREVMQTEVVQATAEASARSLAQQMADRHVSCVVIVSETEAGLTVPVGIVTERDMVQCSCLELDLDRLSIIHDISQRKRLELEQQRHIDALQQLNQDLEDRVAARTQELSQTNAALMESHCALLESQEQLRRNEELLRLTIDNAPIGIVTIDPNGRFLMLNPTFYAMLGYSRSETIGGTFYSFLHPADREASRAAIQTLIDGKTTALAFESRYIHKNGATVDTIVRVSVARDGDTILHLVAEIEDIRERKRAEQALKQQLAAIDAANDGIAILNSDGRYQFVNTAHGQLFGMEPTDLYGQSWRTVYAPNEVARFERDVFLQLDRDGHWRGEAIATRRDGLTFPQEVSLTQIDGVGLVCVCQDISDRKQAEADIREALDTERELNEMKSRFVSVTSHEFRTPLGIIASSAGSLQTYADRLDETKRRKHFDRINRPLARIKRSAPAQS